LTPIPSFYNTAASTVREKPFTAESHTEDTLHFVIAKEWMLIVIEVA
jgi:hypothetical protein